MSCKQITFDNSAEVYGSIIVRTVDNGPPIRMVSALYAVKILAKFSGCALA